jgi:hypothetical protein
MRRMFVLVAVVTALLVSAMPAAAITGNVEVDEIHPYVGLIVFYDDEGDFSHRCSGTLLSPSVFLTAGHCTDDGGTARIWFETFAGAAYDPETDIDPVTGYPWHCEPGTLCVTASVMYNMGFDNFAGFPNIQDAGIVILDEPVHLAEYPSLAEAGSLTPLATQRGRQDVTFTLSGYGITQLVPFFDSRRTRLMATSQLVNLRNVLTAGFNLQTTANPGRGRGGACFGDSGGPVFYSNTDVIVAITSFGITPWCTGIDFAWRTDTDAVINWILGIAENHGEAHLIDVTPLP